ncbi:synaptogyrin-1 isoform X2 [Bos indicus x Bos taurus]|uniref:synaptogyrin-1 isoform X2 n=1 Tax=Bos indicus x Bos taurus TaxID=30522 RepID=UPI000F7D3186|nr:synaptogyrin-1 isoform X2 [Bos indicus x Bos taurus]
MEGGAYGAGKAGGAFDPYTLVRQPHTILRVVSWVFSIVVFGSIVNEGYLNSPSESEEFCIYNRNPNACGYGVTVGVLAFLTCLLYLALDVYFPQISSVKDRKKAVLSDIGVSAFWAFLWFVGFCFLANQWQVSEPKDNPLNEGTDAARAAIAFSFFSIFTWAFGLSSAFCKKPPGLYIGTSTGQSCETAAASLPCFPFSPGAGLAEEECVIGHRDFQGRSLNG